MSVSVGDLLRHLSQVKRPTPPPTATTRPMQASPYAKPGPYQTPLPPPVEQAFQAWVAQNQVPFDPHSAEADYDMRGFYQALQSGDPRAAQALNPNVNALHYPDTWKTPYHQSFSNESIYAKKNAPHWVGSRLVDAHGKVVYSEGKR